MKDTHTHGYKLKLTLRYILRNGKTYLLLHPVATAAVPSRRPVPTTTTTTTILNQLGYSAAERASVLYLVSHRYACHLCAVFRLQSFLCLLFCFFFFCFCISFLSASASRQTVYKQQSWRLASPRRAVCHNIATCRICNVTSFTRWPIKLAEREGGGGRERGRERKVCVCVPK